MRIANIKYVGKRKVFDLSVDDVEHYILENGVITHNTGSYYSADNIFIIGRQQEKEGTEIVGYNFIINVEKSRYVKEKSKIPVTVSFEGGINKFSGLLEVAIEGGFVVKPSNGWYSKVDLETGEVLKEKVRIADTQNAKFWTSILESDKFKQYIKQRYEVAYGSILETEEETEEA